MSSVSYAFLIDLDRPLEDAKSLFTSSGENKTHNYISLYRNRNYQVAAKTNDLIEIIELRSFRDGFQLPCVQGTAPWVVKVPKDK